MGKMIEILARKIRNIKGALSRPISQIVSKPIDIGNISSLFKTSVLFEENFILTKLVYDARCRLMENGIPADQKTDEEILDNDVLVYRTCIGGRLDGHQIKIPVSRKEHREPFKKISGKCFHYKIKTVYFSEKTKSILLNKRKSGCLSIKLAVGKFTNIVCVDKVRHQDMIVIDYFDSARPGMVPDFFYDK